MTNSQLPEDRFCSNLEHSNKPDFQALRKMADLAAARAEAEVLNKQFRYEIFREIIQKKGEWE